MFGTSYSGFFLFQDGESFCVCQFFFLMCFGEFFLALWVYIWSHTSLILVIQHLVYCVWVMAYFLDFLFPLSYYSSLVSPFIEWMVP